MQSRSRNKNVPVGLPSGRQCQLQPRHFVNIKNSRPMDVDRCTSICRDYWKVHGGLLRVFKLILLQIMPPCHSEVQRHVWR